MSNLSISDIKKVNKSKNIFFDEKNWRLIEISKIYDLNKSKATKLALIYFENRKHIDKNDNKNLISFESTWKRRLFDEDDMNMISDYIRENYTHNKDDDVDIRDIIIKRLWKYTPQEILIIFENLKHLSKKDIEIFLNNFEVLDEFNQIKKYNLNEINNLTLYFLLKNKDVDLFERFKNKDKRIDRRRNKIVDFIYVIENDLVRSGIGNLLGMENPWYSQKKRKKIRLLEELIKNRFIKS